jgi:hypothetical protein
MLCLLLHVGLHFSFSPAAPDLAPALSGGTGWLVQDMPLLLPECMQGCITNVQVALTDASSAAHLAVEHPLMVSRMIRQLQRADLAGAVSCTQS